MTTQIITKKQQMTQKCRESVEIQLSINLQSFYLWSESAETAVMEAEMEVVMEEKSGKVKEDKSGKVKEETVSLCISEQIGRSADLSCGRARAES